MHVYALLAIESYDGHDSSFEDTSAQLDDIKCSLHGSLEAAKEAAQTSLDKSLGDHLEEGEDRKLLDWHAEGQACQPPLEPKNWYAADLYSLGYREYQIRLLPLSDS